MGCKSKLVFILFVAIVASIPWIASNVLDVETLFQETEKHVKLDSYYDKTVDVELSLHDGKESMQEKELHVKNLEKDDDEKHQKDFTCAPWIPIEKRKIIMLSFQSRFVTWDDHLRGIIKGGEAYWSACVEYVLRDLGFNVTVTNEKLDPTDETMQQLDRGEIHRVITDTSSGGNFESSAIWGMPELLCKVRQMVWWPAPRRPRNEFSILPFRYDDISITSAHFVPFFVHQYVTDPPITEIIPRSRRAVFIFTKLCGELVPDVLVALYEAGFELHLQCQRKVAFDLVRWRNPTLNEVYGNFTFHPFYETPKEFADNILKKVAMVIGVGDPVDSPTPIEALYNGAAFLNPYYGSWDKNDIIRDSQHQALRNLGPPYVYNYNATFYETLDYDHDVDPLVRSIVENAELVAAAEPFITYTPADYSLDAVRSYVCHNIVEYDPCQIPGQT